MANPICYGDIIYLEFHNLILYSNGFYDEELYLISTENIAYRPFRNGLFKLCPNLSYKDTDQTDQLNHQLYLFETLTADKPCIVEGLNREIEAEKDILKKHEHKLDILNNKITNEAMGHPIKYGQKIQLLHVASQTFVSISKDFNKEDHTIKNLKLTTKGSQSLYFTFKAKLAFLQEGEVVEYDTPINFVSCETETPVVQGPRLDLKKFRTELNPKHNSLTNDYKHFLDVEPRRKVPLFQAVAVFKCGAKLIEKPDSTYIHKFISFRDQEKANKKKSLKNGDFIRISNDKIYLTAYQMREGSSLFFQTFGSHQEYKHSTIYTMFQILEIPEQKIVHEEESLEKETFKALHLPRGHLIKYNENQRYMIKHVISGKYLAFEDEVLTLVDFKAMKQKSKGISIMVKNKAKHNVNEKYIDRNSIVQLKFYNHLNEEQGILNIGDGIKSLAQQTLTDSDFLSRFQMTDKYLDKFLRTERYSARTSNHIANQFSCFKFIQPSEEEMCSIFFAESLADQIQRFIDFLDEFMKGKHLLQDFDEEVTKLTDVCNTYTEQMHENTYKEEDEDNLRLNTVRQTLLREFRIYDLIYRVFYFVLLKKELLRRIKRPCKENVDDVYTESELERIISLNNFELMSKVENKDDLIHFEILVTERDDYYNHKTASANELEGGIEYSNLLVLFESLKKIVLRSFMKNNLNKHYCSQFVSISIECLLYADSGIFHMANYDEVTKTREIILLLCKEGLWDQDLDALKRLNKYEEPFFEAFEKQETFHTIYLELMKHISNSQAPNLQNEIRDNFVFEFIPKEGMMQHIFPQLYEDNGEISIKFTRKSDQNLDFILNLDKLVERSFSPDFKDSTDHDTYGPYIKYFIEAVELIFALRSTDASMFDLKVVRYYPLDLLKKAINTIGNNPYCQRMRAVMTELISKPYKNYFGLAFTKLPQQIQITLNNDTNVTQVLNEIDSIITDSIDQGMIAKEIEYLKTEGDEAVVHVLKKLLRSKSQTIERFNQIDLNVKLINLKAVPQIIENIDKVLRSDTEIKITFLKETREFILKMLRGVIDAKEKSNYHLIKLGLQTFSELEKKIILIAATDIAQTLKNKSILTLSPMATDGATNKSYSHIRIHKPPFYKLIDPPTARSVQTETSFFNTLSGPMNHSMIRELSAQPQSFDEFATKLVHEHTKQWKSGAKLQLNSETDSGTSIVQEDIDISRTLKILLDAILLENDDSLNDIMKQLKRVSTFESLLYKELEKISVIHSSDNLLQLKEVVKATFRLDEMSREIFFCQDSMIIINPEKMHILAQDTLNQLWKLFFIIYNVSKHFRENTDEDPQKRFIRCFENVKKAEWDICIQLYSEPISKLFQKVFNTLKTYRALVKVLHWALEAKHDFLDSELIYTYIIRLVVFLLIVFVKNNKENQQLTSTMRGFIKQFYNVDFTTKAPDALIAFAEVVRDNKKLLKLPTRYLYDITILTFVKHMTQPILNNQENGFLTASIMSLHFLSQAFIPAELYNPIATMKHKWQEISKVSSFTSLNIINSKNDIGQLPHCYYSIQGLMESTLEITDIFASNPRDMNEIRQLLSFSSWLSFFESENFFLHYELKNLLTKCMTKIYFNDTHKIEFIKEPKDCIKIFMCLVNDIVIFRKYRLKITKEQSSEFDLLSKNLVFAMKKNKCLNLMRLYIKIKDIDLEEKNVQIFLEDISLYNLLSEYVFDGCLDLLFNIVTKEAELCAHTVIDIPNGTSSIIKLTLLMLEDLIKFEVENVQFSNQKIIKFLDKIQEIQAYSDFREKITLLMDSLNRKARAIGRTLKRHRTEVIQRKSVRSMNSTERYSRVVDKLKSIRLMHKEQSIKMVAEHIENNPKKKVILKEVLKHLKRNMNKIDRDETIFVLRLLRKYIERENTNNSDAEPVYLWKEVKYVDFKKIERIQHIYIELGLSEILYSLFATNDSKVFRETLLLSLAYLYGGNLKVQQDFYANFQADDENLVISRISQRLVKSWDIFRSKELERFGHLYRKGQRIIFDHLKEKGDDDKHWDHDIGDDLIEKNLHPDHIQSAKDEKHNKLLMLILTFLQALCEKQFTKIQNFLREQKTEGHLHQKPFDFLIFLRRSMNTYYRILNNYNLPVGNKILDLITELLQGEVHHNISVFLSKTFIYDMCRVLTDFNSRYHTLPRGFGTSPFHPNFQEFKSKIIFLFKTVLENGNKHHMEVLKQYLNIPGLMNTLEGFMTKFISEKKSHLNGLESTKMFISSLSSDDFKGILGDSINIYIIFRYIWDDPSEFDEKMTELIHGIEKGKQSFMHMVIFSLCNEIANSIEITVHMKAQPLIRVWFPVVAICHHLRDDSKLNFMKSVDRSNSQTKISGLLDSSRDFQLQMESNYSIRQRFISLSLFYNIVELITYVLLLVINIMNLGAYKFENATIVQNHGHIRNIERMNRAQIVFSALLILLWWFLYQKSTMALLWERYVGRNIKLYGFLPQTITNKLDSDQYEDLTMEECTMIMKLKGANSDEFKSMKKNTKAFQDIKYKYYWNNLYFSVRSFTFLWHCLFLFIAIGSVYHPIVAIFQLLSLAIWSETLQQIYISISRNSRQFFWTLFLLVSTNLVYSSIGFFFLNDIFIDTGNTQLCETTFSCFINVLNQGLRSGGGIGDVIRSQPYDPDHVGRFVALAIFDLSFFVIMIILFLNLIFGMIIDAFGSLRDLKNRNDEDQKNVCFICGISRSEFERHTNFEKHVKREHNIWAYVNYIAFLLEKQRNDKNSMTDIENFVLEKYLVKDNAWVPIGKSLTLERIYEREKFSKDSELSRLSHKVNSVQDSLNQMNALFKNSLNNSSKNNNT